MSLEVREKKRPTKNYLPVSLAFPRHHVQCPHQILREDANIRKGPHKTVLQYSEWLATTKLIPAARPTEQGLSHPPYTEPGPSWSKCSAHWEDPQGLPPRTERSCRGNSSSTQEENGSSGKIPRTQPSVPDLLIRKT